MLREFAQYIVGLRENKTYEIRGQTYSDNPLIRIEPHVDRPVELEINGLDSCVKLVKAELKRVEALPLYIRAVSHREVEVFTSWGAAMKRDYLYRVRCDAPELRGGWKDYEDAIITLRSCYEETEDLGYLLDLLGSIVKEDGVQSEDNGVSQVVTVTQGVKLKKYAEVKPRVALAPYRTFTEVAQPVSEFILRLDGDGRVGLLEADGGKWRLEAKKSILDFFEERLQGEIDSGAVIVMK